jgi:glycosyltransferase involved in cell wall biosynthesis
MAETGAAELVAPGDAPALHIALKRLIGDPERRRSMASAATAAASGPYSWREAAERTLDVYRSLISPATLD